MFTTMSILLDYSFLRAPIYKKVIITENDVQRAHGALISKQTHYGIFTLHFPVF